MTSIAMIMTGSSVWTMKDGTPHPTGFWAEEFVKPHRTFSDAGMDITLSTPQGRTPTVDPLSYNLAYNENDERVVAGLKEYLEGLRNLLENTTPVADLDPSRLDVVFVVGGHGPMQDLAVDPNLSDLFTAVLDDPAKVLAAVCHGPASFLSAHRPDGTWLFRGRRLTGFSNEEETQAGFAGNAPWLLEDRLRLAGAQYAAESAWTPHAEVDGNLVTGQQNYSAQVTADAVMKVLSSLPGGCARQAQGWRTLMKYRNLGRTGIKVSPYALGALMFATAVGNPDPEDSIRIIHKALDAGINLVDTADAYGDSEEVVGRALKGRRDNVVLATKVSRPMGTDPNRQGASRRWITTAVENSLRRLQTDHIDVYQIHRPDPDTDIEETLSVLTDLVRSGKIRAAGTSTMPASDLVEAHWVAERRGLERFRTEQPPYSILNRGVEREVLPVAQKYGTGILAWGPLGQGMLTGRVRRGQDNDVTRARFFTAFRDDRRLDAVERLIPLAEEAGLSMPHLAMAFAISHPGVTSALLGPRTMEQLDDLLAGVDVVLSDDVLDRIDEIVPPGTDVGTLDQAYVPPAIQRTELRRRPLSERSAA